MGKARISCFRARDSLVDPFQAARAAEGRIRVWSYYLNSRANPIVEATGLIIPCSLSLSAA